MSNVVKTKKHNIINTSYNAILIGLSLLFMTIYISITSSKYQYLCAASPEALVKKDFFENYDYTLDILPRKNLHYRFCKKFYMQGAFNTCYFECFIFSVLSDKAFCDYLLNTEFVDHQVFSATLANLVCLAHSKPETKVNLCDTYLLLLNIINSANPTGSTFELNNQVCFKEFSNTAYEFIIRENEMLYTDITCENRLARVFPITIKPKENEFATNRIEKGLSSYVHTLMLSLESPALNMEQILTNITENASNDEKDSKNDYNFICDTLRIYTNRFEVGNERKRLYDEDNAHRNLKTYFSKCFTIGDNVYLFRIAIIYRPSTSLGEDGHYFSLFYDYKKQKFYIISGMKRFWIEDERAHDFLFEESVMVAYERINID